MGRQRALLIGVEDYENLSKVDFARADVTAMRDRLTKVCSYRPEDVLLMTDEATGEYRPTHDRIIAALRRMLHASEPDDSFLLFFAGHGMTRGGKSYLAAVNANAEDEYALQMTSVPLELLRELVGSIPARQKVILTDACRSAPDRGRALDPNPMQDGFRQGFRDIVVKPAARAVTSAVGIMLACDEGQRAYPWPEKGHGVFCHYLLEALSERSADEQGNIVFPRVEEHIQRGLEEWSRERPERRQTPCFEVRGHVILGRLPETARRPAPRIVLVDASPATIVLRTEIAGSLLVDGEPQGNVTAGRIFHLQGLAAGQHDIELRGAGEEFKWSGELAPGESLEIVARSAKSAKTPAPVAAEAHDTTVQLSLRLGHWGYVNSVAFSADGQVLITGDEETITFWNAGTGEQIESLLGRCGAVSAIALSPDGAWLVSAGRDKTLRLWDVEARREIRSCTGHTGEVNAVAISNDGRVIVSGGADKTIRLWEAATGREIRVLTGHTGGVESVAISADGAWIVSGAHKAIAIWDAGTGRQERLLEGHTGHVNGIVFTPDSRTVVSGSEGDNTIRIWDRTTGRELRSIPHPKWVHAIAISPDGKMVASAAGGNKSVHLWEIATGREVRSFLGHNDNVHSVSFSRDGGRIASGDNAGNVIVWDLSGRRLTAMERVRAGTLHLDASGDGRWLLSKSGRVYIWETATGRPLHAIKVGGSWPYGPVRIAPEGDWIASGLEEGTIKTWDTASGRLKSTLAGHQGTVRAIAISADARSIVSGGDDQFVRIWDCSSGREVHTLRGHDSRIVSVAISRDGRMIASQAEGTVKLWNAQTGRETRSLIRKDFKGNPFFGAQGFLAFSPDGKWIASVLEDIKVWDTENGKEKLLSPAERTFWRDCVEFSPDGLRILANTTAGVTVWDVASGLPSRLWKTSGSKLAVISNRIAVTNGNGSLDYWAIATGQLLLSVYLFYDGNWLIHTPDGYFDASAGALDRIAVRQQGRISTSSSLRSLRQRPDIIQARLSGKGV